MLFFVELLSDLLDPNFLGVGRVDLDRDWRNGRFVIIICLRSIITIRLIRLVRQTISGTSVYQRA